VKKRNIWFLTGFLILVLANFILYVIHKNMITDTTPPRITIEKSDLAMSVYDDEDAFMRGVTAYDDIDGDVTELILVENIYGMTSDHRTNVVYAAFDHSGNVSKAERSVYYTDYHSPRFTLSRSLTFEFGMPFDVMSYIDAYDVIDGDIGHRVKATMLSSGVTVNEEGIHNVQFRVTNSIGDSVQMILPVEVYPADSYNAELTLTEYLIYLKKGEEFNSNDYVSCFQTHELKLNLTEERPKNFKVRTRGSVNTDVPGIYPVSYTAEYTQDGRKYSGYSCLIVNVEEVEGNE